ncbi:histone deacetylase A [Apiospora hydei]|uniref:histone deacetylase n=1 Tax=Apiospora hydei TaxID=1337664 RepID=A0ABR1XDU3_9PEZI
MDQGHGASEGADHVMLDVPNGLGDHENYMRGENGSNRAAFDGESDLEIDEYEMRIDEDAFLRNNMTRRALLPTGCCYDPRMKLHANADFGPSPHHPEDPRRIEEIMKMLKKAGLVYNGPDTDLQDILRNTPTKYMWRIPARYATRQEICTMHTPQHYDWVEDLSQKDTQELRKISSELDQGRDSLYVGAMSRGEDQNGLAIIRPPGHHAEYNAPMGFCLFNNVPIAARICQVEFPETCRKILILDWDVHHGNGVQNMFYDDPNVLYISLHVYANGEFYPGKPDNPEIPDGGIEQVGEGVGRGKNVNIGWVNQGMGDGEYLAAFQEIVMPIAQEFDPDMVIISAGFDAADGDELGGCFVSPPCYAHMTHMLMSLAGGKVAVCLEGGYNLKAISIGYQRQVLAEKCGLIPLFIQREALFKSFENQVLISPGIMERRKIILIIHDPPELVAMPDLIDNKVDPHNAFVMDGVTSYIEWAHQNDFGIIDANIPHYITHPEDTDPYIQGADERTLGIQMKELMNYIWDNYLQLWEAEDIFLVGVGNAYLGVKLLLTERHCKDRISGVINFVTGNLRPVKSSVDEDLSGWYKRNSLVYVADDHACWIDADMAKKVSKKRFGGVKRSSQTGLNKMMHAHAGEVHEWIVERVTSDKAGDDSTDEDTDPHLAG